LLAIHPTVVGIPGIAADAVVASGLLAILAIAALLLAARLLPGLLTLALLARLLPLTLLTARLLAAGLLTLSALLTGLLSARLLALLLTSLLSTGLLSTLLALLLPGLLIPRAVALLATIGHFLHALPGSLKLFQCLRQLLLAALGSRFTAILLLIVWTQRCLCLLHLVLKILKPRGDRRFTGPRIAAQALPQKLRGLSHPKIQLILLRRGESLAQF